MRASILLIFAACAFAAQQFDVRKITLGMTQEQVRATHSDQPVSITQSDGETLLRYPSTEFLPSSGTIQYAFRNGLLAHATYIFALEHPGDPNEFVADFHIVEAKLRASLKEPVCEQTVWLDDSLQNERIPYLERDRGLPSDILPSDVNAGLSISVGHLQFVVVWDTPGMQVVHTMTGADHKISHVIEFRQPHATKVKSDLADTCQTPR
jgi:hypothetical protein